MSNSAVLYVIPLEWCLACYRCCYYYIVCARISFMFSVFFCIFGCCEVACRHQCSWLCERFISELTYCVLRVTLNTAYSLLLLLQLLLVFLFLWSFSRLDWDAVIRAKPTASKQWRKKQEILPADSKRQPANPCLLWKCVHICVSVCVCVTINLRWWLHYDCFCVACRMHSSFIISLLLQRKVYDITRSLVF